MIALRCSLLALSRFWVLVGRLSLSFAVYACVFMFLVILCCVVLCWMSQIGVWGVYLELDNLI